MPHSGSSKRRNLNPSITYSDFVAISQWAKRNRWQILMAAGILIRTLGYAMSRAFWLDESSLYGNVFDQPAFDVMTQLKHEQVVPPGFLIVLRFTYQIFGQNENALRFIPFLCGTLGFILFAKFCKDHLPASSGYISAALFAFNSDLIYYCQEMKPYAMDLLCSVLVLRIFMKIRQDSSVKWVSWEIMMIAISPWFSIAGVFNIVGLIICLGITFRHNLQKIKPLWIMTFIWGLMFIITYAIEKRQVSPQSGLWVFWDFAFLKWNQPLQNLALLLDNLINPLHLLTNIRSTPIMLTWAFLIMYALGNGSICLIRRDWDLFRLIMICFAILMTVSLLKLYPTHGRTLLSITPFVLCVFGEGLWTWTQRTPPNLRKLLWLLIVTPYISFCWTSPFYGVRPVLYDGDLEPDHFTHAFGLMSLKPLK